MAFSSRELYLVLRARDEASRTLRGVSASIMSTAAASAAATARTAAAYERQRAASLRAQAQAARMYAQQLRSTGATKAQIQAAEASARAYDNAARSATAAARGHDRAALAAANNAREHEHLVNVLHQSGVALQTIGVVMFAAGAMTLGALSTTISAANEYARQVALTKTQVDGFAASMSQLSEIGLHVANNVGVAFEQIQPELYDIFSSTSANLKQSQILLEAFAKASVAGQVDMQSATRTTLSIMNAFHIPFEDVNKVLDIQFQLVRKGVGTYSQFAAVIGQVIPAASRSGQTFQTVAGMLAFLTRNGLSASSAAASAARALEAMANPKTIVKLKALGVEFYNAKGQARPLVDVLSDLQAKLSKMSHPQQVQALSELLKGSGGTIQARRFLDQVLLQPGELGSFKEMLNAMNNATGQFGEAYNTMADTAATRTQLLKNQWKTLQISVGQTLVPIFNQIVAWATKLLGAFNNLSPATKDMIVKGVAFGAALLVVAGIIITVVGGLATLIAAISGAGEALAVVAGIVVGVTAGLVGFGAAFRKLWRDSKNFRDIVAQVRTTLAEMRDTVVETFQKLLHYYNTRLDKPLTDLWHVIEQKVLPVLRDLAEIARTVFLKDMREAIRVISDEAAPIFSFIAWIINNLLIPAIKTAVDWWNKHKDVIIPVLEVLGQLAKWILIIVGIILGVLVVAIIAGAVAAFLTLYATIATIIAIFTALAATVRWVIDFIIKQLANIVEGAAHAFGWIPGLGPKLRAAADEFYNWANDVNKAVSGIVSGKTVTLTIQVVAQVSGALAGAAMNALTGKSNLDVRKNVKGAFASGGLVRQSGLYWVGEHGPELRMLNKGDRIFDASESRRMVNGGVGSVRPVGPPAAPVIHKHYNITQNITTQEINPVKQSADLGWAIQAVL